MATYSLPFLQAKVFQFYGDLHKFAVWLYLYVFAITEVLYRMSVLLSLLIAAVLGSTFACIFIYSVNRPYT